LPLYGHRSLERAGPLELPLPAYRRFGTCPIWPLLTEPSGFVCFSVTTFLRPPRSVSYCTVVVCIFIVLAQRFQDTSTNTRPSGPFMFVLAMTSLAHVSRPVSRFHWIGSWDSCFHGLFAMPGRSEASEGRRGKFAQRLVNIADQLNTCFATDPDSAEVFCIFYWLISPATHSARAEALLVRPVLRSSAGRHVPSIAFRGVHTSPSKDSGASTFGPLSLFPRRAHLSRADIRSYFCRSSSSARLHRCDGLFFFTCAPGLLGASCGQTL